MDTDVKKALARQDRFLGKKTVFDMVGLSDTTIWRMERKGDFPKRKQLSVNRVAWLQSEIEEWMSNRAKAI